METSLNKTAAIFSPNLTSTFLGEIKQTLLLFDVVAIPITNVFTEKFNSIPSEYQSHFNDNLDYLEETGLIFKSVRGMDTKFEPGTNPIVIDSEIGLERHVASQNDYATYADGIARVHAFALNHEDIDHDFHCVPIVKNPKLPSNFYSTERGIILNVLLHNIPIPNEQTPLEAILDFKNDKDNIGRIAALRKWANKTAKLNLPPAELKDEIDDLLYRYRKSLEIHKIKYSNGILQSLVVGSAELFENIIKLKFSNIAKNLFSMHDARADLMLAELNSPGNELAYIYSTQEKFHLA
ncbi:hypothetical protein [Adhaeribacter rhizoryzae]|uniref:Uncharacterized protein n=1 Tax=Adhaeribacter rhizoryzae TaxID=2607907 RepID=A0A5M6D181_9BACT|nr:hypothetical protein [Adhaeribacter rhizoryzae]KAA5538865.1 hypothetical protein F0145_25520 [Adhaeribacter rhizoryzae]